MSLPSSPTTSILKDLDCEKNATKKKKFKKENRLEGFHYQVNF